MDSPYRGAAKKGDATTLISYPSFLPVVVVAPLQFHPRTEATVQGSLGRRAEGLVGQVEEAQALEVRRRGQGQPAGLAHVIAGHVEVGEAGEARGLGDGPGFRALP